MLVLAHFTYGPEGNQWRSDTSKTVILLFWHRKAASLVQEFRDLKHWVAHSSSRGSNMPPMIMNNEGMCQAEMLLDSDTRRAFIMKDPVPWYYRSDYRCEEPDPSTFPSRWATGQSDLPLKFVDSEGTHTKAAEGYAHALRKNMVKGLPVYLLRATLPPKAFLDHLGKGDICIWPEIHTVAYTKKMNLSLIHI